MPEETAPPFESWTEHLKSLDENQLCDLARDYQWLDERTRAEQAGEEFHRRREAVIAECERRGMQDVAGRCRRPAA